MVDSGKSGVNECACKCECACECEQADAVGRLATAPNPGVRTQNSGVRAKFMYPGGSASRPTNAG
jgi:hypothetical protein